MGEFAAGICTSVLFPVESVVAGWRPILTHEASVSLRTLRRTRQGHCCCSSGAVTDLATSARIAPCRSGPVTHNIHRQFTSVQFVIDHLRQTVPVWR